jgi:hypothetical protein
MRIFTVCPDFLRPMSDQLEAGQYVLLSDAQEEIKDLRAVLRSMVALFDSGAWSHANIKEARALLGER